MNATAPTGMLVICRSSPYGSSRVREGIDLAMAFAAFDQEVAFLFLGEGVFALHAAQEPAGDAAGIGGLLGTLADYGVEKVYADAAALALRGIAADALVIPAIPADENLLRELLASHQRVITV